MMRLPCEMLIIGYGLIFVGVGLAAYGADVTGLVSIGCGIFTIWEHNDE